jgi:transcriptional regulator GlxA family with amidase domain
MSVRTFTRRFRAEVGLTPGQWLTRAAAGTGPAPARKQRPAGRPHRRQAGFGAAVSLRPHFRTAFGVSPAAHRRTFRTRNGYSG